MAKLFINFKRIAAIAAFHLFIRNSIPFLACAFNLNPISVTNKGLNPILISIEGNIGAGKTTLLKHLKNKHPEWVFIDEPVDTWSNIRNDAGESILEVFYKDRKRWSYTFQNCALLTRYQNIESSVNEAKLLGKTGNHIFLTERCLDTDYHVFTKMLRDEGSIDKLELELYERLLKQLKTTATPLSAIIHVNTVPEVCVERIIKRSRIGENSISLNYLKSLDYHQRKWIDSTNVPTTQTNLSNIDDITDFINGLILKKTLIIQSS